MPSARVIIFGRVWRTLVASLLLVAAYVAGVVADTSLARNFAAGTPFADLPTAHSKAQRPARLQVQTSIEDTARELRFGGAQLATAMAPVDAQKTPRRSAFSALPRLPRLSHQRRRKPREPPLALL